MKPRLLLRPEAQADLGEAFNWYEERRAGLGKGFLEAIEEALASIERSPVLYPCVHKQVRRALAKGFPYGVFYLVEEDRIAVLAISHQARDPRHWKRRL